MMSSKIAAVSVLLSAGLLLGATDNASLPKSSAELRFDKVTICHFANHVGDFVTFNSQESGNPVCDADGGNAITLAPSGCANGHKAFARFGKTCDDGASQP